MASNIIHYRHADGRIRRAPIGFSWTVFFFGVLVPIWRRDWTGALLMLVTAILTLGLSYWYFVFAYNKQYVRRLLADGFQIDATLTGIIPNYALKY